MAKKTKKILVTCANDQCGFERSFNPNYSSFLGCPQCGGIHVIFDRPVVRVCEHCGTTEHLPADAPVAAYHQSPHSDCIFFESEGAPADIPDEPDEESAVPDDVKPTRKRTRRRVAQ